MTFFENLTLREAASVVSECDLYVGNDSSMKHIAVAFQKPTFTIFGPEQPLEWHPYPYSEHPYAFVDSLACRTESGKHWCAIETCKKYEHQCMGKIKPEDIFPVVVSLIEKLEK